MQEMTVPRSADRIKLTIGALGVVYGDIGTSPLYTIKECFHGMHAIDPIPTNVLGGAFADRMVFDHCGYHQAIFLTIQPEDIPAFPESDRLSCESLNRGFHRNIARYGFMETPNVPRIMNRAFQLGLAPHVRPISYYLGRETLLLTGKSKMSRWRLHIFAYLSRNFNFTQPLPDKILNRPAIS